MIISNTLNPNSDFQISINHNLIDRTNTVKYLGVYLNSDSSRKTHIDYLAKRLSKVCGMIYKLHHFVPKCTLKVVYFCMFNSVLQYSLLNWGRACKSHLQKLSILQNKIIRACLFCSWHDSTALLTTVLQIWCFKTRRYDKCRNCKIYVQVLQQNVTQFV